MREASLWLLADAALKGAVLLLIAAALAFTLRRASAARRHLLWSAAVTALLLIPLLSFVMPAWGVLPTVSTGVTQPFVSSFEAAPSQVLEHTAPPASAEPITAGAQSWHEAPPARVARFSTSELLLFGWGLGAALVLISMLIGFVRVAMLARRSVHIKSGRIYETTHALGAEHGVRVQLLQGNEHAMPMTWGLFRTKLLLPGEAAGWSEVRLHAVLRHELAHVRRRDALWQLVAELACALHWFNPLAWYAAHRMRVEREHACDDAVLVAGSRPSEYARELLDIARSMRAARATSLAAIAMARPRQLEGRLLAVLDTARSRDEVSRRWPVWLAASFVVLPLAAVAPSVEVAAALPTEQLAAAPPVSVQEPTSWPERPRVATAGVMAIVDQTPDCLKGSLRNMSTSINSDDDHTRVKWSTRDCKGTMDIRGQAKIAGDLSGFQSITPGGRVTIETQDPEFKRKLTLTPSNGRFAYVYEVDGRQHAWDEGGRSWLASVLAMVVRNGGFAAEERVDYLLREKGTGGVLEEVALIHSDYTQRRYLELMLKKTTLNAGAVGGVLELAGSQLDSDYELAQLLMAVTKKYDLTPASRAAYLKAVQSVESDYERGRALQALLAKTSLSRDDQVAVLNLAAGMNSNYERSQVLQRISGAADLSDTRIQEAYVKAAGVMDSDYELRKVLSSLVRRERLVPSALDVVITAAGSIESDYELAELLTGLLGTQTLNAAQRTRVVKLMDSIESEYERGKVASRLVRQMGN